jgi:hypothetical protein
MRHGLAKLSIVMVPLLLACSSASPTTAREVKSGLLETSQLPAGWHPYRTRGPIPKRGLCGDPLPENYPKPTRRAAAAWALDATDGPIFGERIETFASRSAAYRTIRLIPATRFPCDFETETGRWRTEAQAPPRVRGGGTVRLILNRDRTDSYNYEVAIPSGRSVLRMVLNARTPDRALLDALVERAWQRFTAATA